MNVKRVTIFLASLAAIGTAAVVWQRLSCADLTRQIRAAPATSSESNMAPSSAMNSELEEETAALRAQTRELPKLRNEVNQLRAKQNEVMTARAEHEQLVRAQQSGARLPREVAPGFISKEQLRNAGYETPEDAIQTFFWAMREGNFELAMQSLSPEERELARLERLSPEKRAQEETNFKRDVQETMEHFNDFTVARREQLSDDTVALHVRSSISTNTSKFQLKRFGAEWKWVGF